MLKLKFIVIAAIVALGTIGGVAYALPCWHGIADVCEPRPCEGQSRCPGIEEK